MNAKTGGKFKAPSYFGAAMPWKASACGRFVVYRYRSEVRGRSAVAQQMYTVFDTETGRSGSFGNLRFVFSFIRYRTTGERTLPWFSGAESEAPAVELVAHPEAV